MTSITLKAPAKVNLYLKVLKKRDDGFHDILTLFERIDLNDIITIRKTRASGITVTSDRFIVRDPRDNLVYKAADALMRSCRVREGAAIHIRKYIPIGSGLGGGSSDAAAVLKGINELFSLEVSRARLMRIGGALGSDVNFFLMDCPFAIGKGKGDRLERLTITRKFWHIVVFPHFKLATKDVYAAFDASTSTLNKGKTLSYYAGRGLFPRRRVDLALTKRVSDATITSSRMFGQRAGRLMSILHNDLQQVVVARKKTVASLIQRLATSSGHTAIISGSGPSVFCLFAQRKEVIRAKERFVRNLAAHDKARWRIFVAGTL